LNLGILASWFFSKITDIYNMCGITGIISSVSNRFNSSDIQKMTAALAHRGPDGEALWINSTSNTLLGHRRLSIIDLREIAAQPMHFENRYTIVHNGEIYNYIELKASLQQNGYSFKTLSDTEVILAAYDRYKEGCLQYLDGMFAFAIWDEKEKKLFAARDRFGEKPFYYFYNTQDRVLHFASELKALWATGLPRDTEESMLLNYLALGLTNHPINNERTFYKNFKRLPAGHYLEFNLHEEKTVPTVTRYWQLDKAIQLTISENDAIERFNELFQRSVANRLRADVSIGTSLSGGLDSSSVVASIHAQLTGNSHYHQQCFTASFPGFEKDETDYASLVVQQFSLQQYTCYPNAAAFSDELEKLILHHEEPISSASVYAQFKIFELARQQNVKVLLDGQGADEILAGYTKYIHWYLQELFAAGKFSHFQSEKRKLRKHAIPFEWGAQNYPAALFPTWTSTQLEKRAHGKVFNNKIFNKEYLNSYFDKQSLHKPAVHRLNDLLYYNTQQLGLEELLRYADKNSMAHGREVRLPFLQHELVQFIFSLPSSFKINNGYTKWILRKAMQEKLPEKIVWRTDKTGFEPPQEEWMKNKGIVDRIQTAKEKLVQQKILVPSVLNQKSQPHSAYAADCNDWRYLVSGILYK
jgi:asparagine synthase (glutamine-hydrolysing)